MNKFEFEHSLKNVPIPNKETYKKALLAQTGILREKVSWKTFFHLNPEAKVKDVPNSYGFRTAKQAPRVKELRKFEEDLYNLVTNVEFKDTKPTHFQNQLLTHAKKIKASNNIFMLADKTTNIYEIEPQTYNKLLTENITKDYQKTHPNKIIQTSKQAKIIAQNLKLDDRIEDQSEKVAYITIKDHKEDFQTKPKCRLINPAKTKIGNISKQLLEKLNCEIREVTGLQQWRSTEEVLGWFENIKNKSRLSFMQIDIVEFYPSISELTLNKALKFASKTLNRQISQKTIDIIRNSRNAFLFTNTDKIDKTNPWRKKTGQFDVTMGAPDGAEVCELIGLMILYTMKEQFPLLNFGLYRDDGLATHRRIPGPKLDRIRKDIHKMFSEFGFKVTIEASKPVVNFLDVSLDLNKESYAPYKKPNENPLYINIHSNHPPNVIKEIPNTINRRLNKISSSKEEFEKAAPTYSKALKESGYKTELEYLKPEPVASQIHTETKKETNKKVKRKIIWFNPPFNIQVKTNIGKEFLKLLDKHFPVNHPLRKVLNRNCVKVSYSCTPNIKSIIQSHNAKISQKCTANTNTSKTTDNTQQTCNCRSKNKCPLNNNCNSGPIVYKAKLKNKNNKEAFYIGSTQNFKERYNNHTASFRDPKIKHATALSTFVWENDMGPEPNIKWEILRKARIYTKGSKHCDLCLTEIMCIGEALKDPNCLNHRTELTSKCAHKERYKLSRIK